MTTEITRALDAVRERCEKATCRFCDFDEDTGCRCPEINRTDSSQILTDHVLVDLPALEKALRIAVDALQDAQYAEKLLRRPPQCAQALTQISEILKAVKL